MMKNPNDSEIRAMYAKLRNYVDEIRIKKKHFFKENLKRSRVRGIVNTYNELKRYKKENRNKF